LSPPAPSKRGDGAAGAGGEETLAGRDGAEALGASGATVAGLPEAGAAGAAVRAGAGARLATRPGCTDGLVRCDVGGGVPPDEP
jgi:hypothetical protein